MRENGCQTEVVSLGFAMYLRAASIPLYVCRSWGHRSTLSDGYRTELLTAEHLSVELGEDTFAAGFILVDELEGGMQNNWISWINVHAISGGEAHRVVHV